MNKINRPLNILLTQNLHYDLERLAEVNHCSCGAYIRQLLRAAAEMQLMGRPRCATGRECFVPHLHPPVIPIAQTPPRTPAPTAEEGIKQP